MLVTKSQYLTFRDKKGARKLQHNKKTKQTKQQGKKKKGKKEKQGNIIQVQIPAILLKLMAVCSRNFSLLF